MRFAALHSGDGLMAYVDFARNGALRQTVSFAPLWPSPSRKQIDWPLFRRPVL